MSSYNDYIQRFQAKFVPFGPYKHKMYSSPSRSFSTKPSTGYEQSIYNTPSKRPKEALVVLDLNGVLYDITYPDNDYFGRADFHPRPYLVPFLRWLFSSSSQYKTIIFSAGYPEDIATSLKELNLGIVDTQPSNNSIRHTISRTAPHYHRDKRGTWRQVKLTRSASESNLIGVWTKDDLGQQVEEFSIWDYQVVKDLDRVWNELSAEKKGSFGPSNTVSIDDSLSKFIAQPNNLVLAKTFDSKLRTRDNYLLQLTGMLVTLRQQSNFASHITKQKWNTKEWNRATLSPNGYIELGKMTLAKFSDSKPLLHQFEVGHVVNLGKPRTYRVYDNLSDEEL